MKRMLFICHVITALFAGTHLHAEVFESDWKTPGDWLLTYDDVNQREWLDLSVSDIAQFSTPHLENALSEIRPGGLFDGFTLATAADAIALAQSAGIDTNTLSLDVNEDATRRLVALLGATHARPAEESVFSVGWLNHFRLIPPHLCPCRESANFHVNTASGAEGMGGLRIGPSDLSAHRFHAGLLLYRVVIPEPSGLLIVLVLLVELAIIPQFARLPMRR